MDREALVEHSYRLAVEQYGQLGVDVPRALEQFGKVAVSVHCWQGDDVLGFEGGTEQLGGGLTVTGNYPGRARSVDELRDDLDQAYSLIPGRHRLNLHAMYGEFPKPVDRNAIDATHFQGWIQWAGQRGIRMDFNPTFFAHPLARDGLTLSHPDRHIRQYWIDHGIATRRIAAAMGAAQRSPCLNNVWIPDGMKDIPFSRKSPRSRLVEALDGLFAEPLSQDHLLDAVECKLFGIGSECYVVGSHEFYLGYAITRNKVLCLDTGHFHPTEVVSDKISAVMMYVPRLLLHVSRGVRWDSDHVVTYTEELQAIMQEIVRGGFLDKVHIGLDYFDASINRVAAWVIGTRNALKAVLAGLLEPADELQGAEYRRDYTARLALLEEQKTFPLGAVWDYHCLRSGVPLGLQWLERVRQYEADVQSKRKG
jgi:L-rhamnose isomerase